MSWDFRMKVHTTSWRKLISPATKVQEEEGQAHLSKKHCDAAVAVEVSSAQCLKIDKNVPFEFFDRKWPFLSLDTKYNCFFRKLRLFERFFKLESFAKTVLNTKSKKRANGAGKWSTNILAAFKSFSVSPSWQKLLLLLVCWKVKVAELSPFCPREPQP